RARDVVTPRLGRGVDGTRGTARGALARTVDVLKRYCRRARAIGVTRIRLSATSAVRDASNRADLDRAVRRWTGEPMEVLAGEDEARISFLGATHGLTDHPRGAQATP